MPRGECFLSPSPHSVHPRGPVPHVHRDGPAAREAGGEYGGNRLSGVTAFALAAFRLPASTQNQKSVFVGVGPGLLFLF